MEKNKQSNAINTLSIIIADDIELTCLMIQASLQKAGYRDIRLASGPDEVLQLIEERPADVALLDWVMPKMSGLALSARIREVDDDNNHYTSIIMLTAKEGVENLVKAFGEGVDDYLNKPINELELAARVHAAGRISTLQNSLLETMRDLEASNQILSELAVTDPLTSLGNRRYITQRSEAILSEVHSRGGVLAFLMIDIDHFKQINDQYGHDTGDQILKKIASRLRKATRPTDVVGRLGGEEFCILMHFCEASHCTASVFERVLKSISHKPFNVDGKQIMVTVSIGVCTYSKNEKECTMEMLLKCADEKLYQAKDGGRNQVVF